MSQQEKIESEIAKLSDQERDMLILPEIQYRLSMFSYVAKSNLAMAERVSGQCNSHFDAVKDILHEMKIININSMQKHDRLIEQALKGNTANLFAIQALTEELKLHKASLSITAGVEGAGKKGVGTMKTVVDFIGASFTYWKTPLSGAALLFFFYKMINGSIPWAEITKYIFKYAGVT